LWIFTTLVSTPTIFKLYFRKVNCNSSWYENSLDNKEILWSLFLEDTRWKHSSSSFMNRIWNRSFLRAFNLHGFLFDFSSCLMDRMAFFLQSIRFVTRKNVKENCCGNSFCSLISFILEVQPWEPWQSQTIYLYFYLFQIFTNRVQGFIFIGCKFYFQK
jgi:hypothetical protein